MVEKLESISTYAGALASAAVVVLAVVMLCEVGMRYLANSPTLWSYEVSYMLNGIIFIFGFSEVTKQDGHVRVDFISQSFSLRGRSALEFVVYLGFILPLFIWLSIHLSHVSVDYYNSGRTSGVSAWNPKMWPYQVILTSGIYICALQLLSTVISLGLKCLVSSEVKS